MQNIISYNKCEVINIVCVHRLQRVLGTATKFKKIILTNSDSYMSYSGILSAANCCITLGIQFAIKMLPSQRSVPICSRFYLDENLEFLSVCAGSRFSASPQSWCAGPMGRCTRRWPALLTATKTQRACCPGRHSRFRLCCPETHSHLFTCGCCERTLSLKGLSSLTLWPRVSVRVYIEFNTFIAYFSDHLLL